MCGAGIVRIEARRGAREIVRERVSDLESEDGEEKQERKQGRGQMEVVLFLIVSASAFEVIWNQ